MPLNGSNSFRIPRARILEAHRDRTAGQDTGVDAGDCLVVDLGHIVDQVVLFVDLFQGVVKDEAD